MDKKKNVFIGFGIVLAIIIIFEFIILPSNSKKYDVEGMKKSIISESEGRFETDFITKKIDNVSELSRKIKDEYENIMSEKQVYIDKSKVAIEKIKNIKEIVEKRDFNYTMFDQELNNIIQQNKLEISLGIPRKGSDDIREYSFDNQSGKIKKARVYFQKVEYRISNVDFEVFGNFLKIIEKKYPFMLFDGIELSKNRFNDGNVDFNINFLIVEKITGKTRNDEVELLR
ncbi:MAG: hypothetical protein M0R46_04565 [Candidatus Muirbacterium halophilum]|nr:hypothetical protein [Candidatus Muirbacterium halophilum]